MNKKGHLYVTNQIITSKFESYEFWVKLGCILPDLLIVTYMKGHTFDSSFDHTIKLMESLEEKGRWNRRSCLRLGYILHYLQDYFTYPHNVNFQGSMKQHIIYEKKFTEYIKENDCIQKDIRLHKPFRETIEIMHKIYMLKNMEMESDYEYIYNVANMALDYFENVFTIEEKHSLGEFVPDYIVTPKVI